MEQTNRARIGDFEVESNTEPLKNVAGILLELMERSKEFSVPIKESKSNHKTGMVD